MLSHSVKLIDSLCILLNTEIESVLTELKEYFYATNISENIPKPKYQFGQKVLFEYVLDDKFDPINNGKTLQSIGFIVGMVYNHPDRLMDGWSYYVEWHVIDSMPVDEPTTDSEHESRLHLTD